MAYIRAYVPVFLEGLWQTAIYVFLAILASLPVGLAVGLLLSALIGDEFVWSIGAIPTALFDGMLVSIPAGFLLYLGGHHLMTLGKMPHWTPWTLVTIAFLAPLAVMAWTPFAASHQGTYFCLLGEQAALIVGITVAVLLIWQDRAENSKAEAQGNERAAQMDAFIARRTASMVRAPQHNGLSSMGIFKILFSIAALWVMTNTVMRFEAYGDKFLAQYNPVCSSADNLCQIRAAMGTIESARNFETARQAATSTATVLTQARHENTTCGNTDGALAAISDDLVVAARNTDPHVFHLRYAETVDAYNSTVRAIAQCQYSEGSHDYNDFIRQLTL